MCVCALCLCVYSHVCSSRFIPFFLQLLIAQLITSNACVYLSSSLSHVLREVVDVLIENAIASF